MFPRSASIATAVLVMTALGSIATQDATRAGDSFATTTSCANPHLGALPVVTAEAPRAKLRLAVAADDETRQVGLMCVTHLKAQTGMLFVFGIDDRVEFWMKHTLIPLDMVWVRTNGTVDTVATNVPKSTLETPDEKVARRAGAGRYVIELSAGEAKIDGIAPGKRIKIPEGLRAR